MPGHAQPHFFEVLIVTIYLRRSCTAAITSSDNSRGDDLGVIPHSDRRRLPNIFALIVSRSC